MCGAVLATARSPAQSEETQKSGHQSGRGLEVHRRVVGLIDGLLLSAVVASSLLPAEYGNHSPELHMPATFGDQDISAPLYADMKDKVAIVTGGTSGIGLATARAFASQGTRVVIASRRQSAAKSALKSLTKIGDVRWVSVDVANGKSVAHLIDNVTSAHGRLDYAFNNAGSGGSSAPVAKMSEAAWRKTIDGYLTSVFLCMNGEIAAMKGIAGSTIVNNASVDGLRGYPFAGGAAYSAAKHGVIGLTRSAALEHAARGPRICAICPGWIDTPPVSKWMKRDKRAGEAIIRQTPRGKIGKPDEIASAVLWLCSGAASFAIGTILAVDGGYTA
jgi:NAD(P)-dependent dehydrogenase (short-subunit alcohol dehydrogenase family)